MTTDHGPQDERPLITQYPDGSKPAPTDHGPQRQPAKYNSVEEMLDAMGEPEMAEVVHELARLRAENERLLRGDFTEEEFQNLCHKFDESDAVRFAAGCRMYWEKLFGDVLSCAGGDEDAELLRRQSVIMEKMRADNERYMRALKLFADENNWRHYLLAGCVEWLVEEFPWKLAADALRGEGNNP